ncbi:MAG: helix-turn-helix transcriptional regulator [Actinomycetota bacterium]
MGSIDLGEQIDLVAVLAEPVRRALYDYVVSQDHEVGRDEAARAVGISRDLAAHHLDRLVHEGLLEAGFRRLTGRSGPGAGRPSKIYRRSSREIAVSLPGRNYRLAAEVLGEAFRRLGGSRGQEAIRSVAGEFGERLGGEARALAGRRRGRAALLDAAGQVLEREGFEPSRNSGPRMVFRNCPFRALSLNDQDLTCRVMNLSFMEGLLRGLGIPGVGAALEPDPGRCCVVVDAV